MQTYRKNNRGAYNNVWLWIILLVLLALGIATFLWIAINNAGHGGGLSNGGGGGGGSGSGGQGNNIILQHSGRFPPNEFVFEGTMQGLSPDYARMLVDKGYYERAGCPGNGFVYTQDPRFSTVIDAVPIGGGLSAQTRGVHMTQHTLQNRGFTCGAAGDWGNTTTRRRFGVTSSAYVQSGFNKIVCATGNVTHSGTCLPTSAWDGTQQLWDAANFVNSAECLFETLPTARQPQVNPVIVANNDDLAAIAGANPGTYALVPQSNAQAFAASNPNATILSDDIKCSPGWGFILNPECAAEAQCLTRANQLVSSDDYNEFCCQYRNPKYDAAFPNWVANNGITFGESAFTLCIADRSTVDDEGGPQVTIGFNQCGDRFCHRPGDAACNV